MGGDGDGGMVDKLSVQHSHQIYQALITSYGTSEDNSLQDSS